MLFRVNDAKIIKQLGSLGAVECNMLIKLPIIFLLKSITNMAEAYSVSVKCVGSHLSGIMVCRIPHGIEEKHVQSRG